MKLVHPIPLSLLKYGPLTGFFFLFAREQFVMSPVLLHIRGVILPDSDVDAWP